VRINILEEIEKDFFTKLDIKGIYKRLEWDHLYVMKRLIKKLIINS